MLIQSVLAKVKVLSMSLHLSKMKKTRVAKYELVWVHEDIGKTCKKSKGFLMRLKVKIKVSRMMTGIRRR
jgi:hypothetical protein